jgi:phosphoglycerate dehydrogenase-like enzyme
MKKKTFISARLDPEWLAKLEPYCEIDHYDWGKANRLLSPDELRQRIPGNEIMIMESDTVTNDMLDLAPELRFIAVCRGSVVNLDVPYAVGKGIQVTNTPGRNADAVADITVCLMIMISRHVREAADYFRDGNWLKTGKKETYLKFQGIELFGRTAGLVGIGAIGSRVAKRLQSFNMKVIGFDPYFPADKAKAFGIELVALDELLKKSDFVSLHAPVTKETQGMLGKKELSLLRSTAYFINTARQELVDDASLIEILKNHKIAGAAIDVYMEEPLPMTSPWYQLDNVLCTPHIGGASQDVIKHQTRMAVQAVIDYCIGKEPEYLLTPVVKK